MIANSKNKARLVILTAFILGVLTGAGAMNLITARYTAATVRQTMLDELSHEVQLDDAQRAQAEAIFKKTRQETQEILKPVQPQLLEARARTRAQIRAILRPDQQARYDEWTRRRDAARYDGPPPKH